MRPKVLVIGPVSGHLRDRLEAAFEIVDGTEAARGGPVPEGAQDVRAILTDGAWGVPDAVLEACPRLEVVSCHGVGYDGIDVGKLLARRIPVSHTPDVLNADVANHAILLLLAASRDLLAEDAHARLGGWAREGNRPLAPSIEGKTIGLVGMGRIGQTIARKLGAFECEVLYHARRPRDVPWEYCPDLVEMARRSWALVVITPGGAETRHLVDADVIEALGPEGILVNVARGSVVDQDALIAALEAGRLGRAALDVFAEEPHIPERLARLGNVILTPHIASATVETRRAMADLAVDNLIDYFETGRVRTPVPECANL